MQIGNCFLILDHFKSNVYRRGVTPAEVAVLLEGFRKEANGQAIEVVYLTGEVKRADHEEIARLRMRYKDLRNAANKNAVEALFPGMARLPQTFAEIPGLVVEDEEPECNKPKDSPTPTLAESEEALLDAVAQG
jgi:hypothetical protein